MGLCAHQDPVDGKERSVQDFRPLGPLQGGHVRAGGRGERQGSLRPAPHDLPLPVLCVQEQPEVLPRPALPLRGDLHAVPQRGLRGDARPHQGTAVHHLRGTPDRAARPDGGGVQGLYRPGPVLSADFGAGGGRDLSSVQMGSGEPGEIYR